MLLKINMTYSVYPSEPFVEVQLDYLPRVIVVCLGFGILLSLLVIFDRVLSCVVLVIVVAIRLSILDSATCAPVELAACLTRQLQSLSIVAASVLRSLSRSVA